MLIVTWTFHPALTLSAAGSERKFTGWALNLEITESSWAGYRGFETLCDMCMHLERGPSASSDVQRHCDLEKSLPTILVLGGAGRDTQCLSQLERLNKTSQTGWLSQGIVTVSDFQGLKSQIKVWQGRFLGSTLPGLQMATLSLCPHTAERTSKV